MTFAATAVREPTVRARSLLPSEADTREAIEFQLARVAVDFYQAALPVGVDDDEGRRAPPTIEVLPAPDEDGLIIARDGRRILADFDRILAEFASNGADLPIDRDHQMFSFAALFGDIAVPSAGWITALRVESDGRMVADVEWVADGEIDVLARRWRYISPALGNEEEENEDGTITVTAVRLMNAALVNLPALRLAELSRARTGAETMDPKKIAEALGIDPGSDTAAALVAIIKLREDLVAAETLAAEAPSLVTHVPRADYETLAAKVVALETASQAQAQVTFATEVDAALIAARTAQKITPASEVVHRSQIKTPEALQQFEELMSVTPGVFAGVPVITGNPLTAGGGMNEYERTTCRQMGISEESFKATRDGVEIAS